MLRNQNGARDLPGASPSAIRAHYDKGNAFFAAWLDPRLTYSAACWRDGENRQDGLEDAQTRKLDWHLKAAGVRDGTRLLDVGCGWGALLSRAVSAHGAALAVGLTPATQQVRWIAEHIAGPRIKVIPQTWQEAHLTTPFDAIISVGALEHFARPYIPPADKRRAYSDFFTFCSRNLQPDGRISLQFIGWMDVPPEREAQNLPKLLFPESNLPRVEEVLAACAGRFHVMQLENVPDDYAKTLKAWLSRLQAQHETLAAAHGKELVFSHVRAFRRFVLGFETGALGLYRISLRHRRSTRARPESGSRCPDAT